MRKEPTTRTCSRRSPSLTSACSPPSTCSSSSPALPRALPAAGGRDSVGRTARGSSEEAESAPPQPPPNPRSHPHGSRACLAPSYGSRTSSAPLRARLQQVLHFPLTRHHRWGDPGVIWAVLRRSLTVVPALGMARVREAWTDICCRESTLFDRSPPALALAWRAGPQSPSGRTICYLYIWEKTRPSWLLPPGAGPFSDTYTAVQCQ